MRENCIVPSVMSIGIVISVEDKGASDKVIYMLVREINTKEREENKKKCTIKEH